MGIASDVIKGIQNNEILSIRLARIFNIYGLKKKKLNGINNALDYTGAYLSQAKIKVNGNNNRIIIGKKSKILNCNIIINGSDHELIIRDNCILSNTNITFTQSSGRIHIGEKTTMNGGLIYSGESKIIEIGSDCMFSSGIDIRTSDSHSVVLLETNERINQAGDIKIGNHVWLGNSVKVWKGSDIGNGAIIGANSIVTKKINENCTAAGTPAKILKENVSWNRSLL